MKNMKKRNPRTKIAPPHLAPPWRVHEGSALIEAYNPALGGWAVVAEGRDSPELAAKAVGAFIVKAVNGGDRREKVIGELIAALELCLECGGLTWAAEQAADVAMKRAGGRG